MLHHAVLLFTCCALQAKSNRVGEEGALLQVKPHIAQRAEWVSCGQSHPVERTWKSRFSQLTQRLESYDDNAVITFHNQNQNSGGQVYRYEGQESIDKFFDWFLPTVAPPEYGGDCVFTFEDRITEPTPQEDRITEPTPQVKGGGSVVLLWSCNPEDGKGYTEGTDTFIFTSDSKVLFQNIVVNYNGDKPLRPPVGDTQVPPTPGNVLNRWVSHNYGFGNATLAKSRTAGIGMILEGYTDDAEIVLFNHVDGSQTIYNTPALRQVFFENLFESFYDLTDFTFQFHLEEGAPGQVFLTWSAAACGYKRGTDTFILNGDGLFTHQNVVVNYEGAPCRTRQHSDMCENGKKKNKAKFRCPCTAPVCGKGQRKKCAADPNTDDLTSDAYDPLCAFCKKNADKK